MGFVPIHPIEKIVIVHAIALVRQIVDVNGPLIVRSCLFFLSKNTHGYLSEFYLTQDMRAVPISVWVITVQRFPFTTD